MTPQPLSTAHLTTLTDLVAAQHGHLTLAQARDRMGRRTVERRISRGEWLRVHPRVLRVAAGPTTAADPAWAAVLAIGAPSALESRTAGLALRLPRVPGAAFAELIVPARREPVGTGLAHVRRVHDWPDRRFTTTAGLACTDVADTVVDLGRLMGAGDLLGMTQDLIHDRRLDADELLRRLRRGREGSAAVRSVLTILSDGHRSHLERRLAGGLRRAGAPAFAANFPVRDAAGHLLGLVDLCWPAQRLAVELDGWAYHVRRQQFQVDRRRQNALVLAAGYTVLRYTAQDLEVRTPDVLKEIIAALAAPRS